jgi:hypothetical protein
LEVGDGVEEVVLDGVLQLVFYIRHLTESVGNITEALLILPFLLILVVLGWTLPKSD